jgi:hypothetical protein
MTENSLSLSIGQQLERAGFLKHLPAVITATAQQLADLQDRPEVIAAGLAVPLDPMFLLQPTPFWQVNSIHSHVQQLVIVLKLMRPLWRIDDLWVRVIPALVPSMMQLLVRLMQHVSLCLSQLPDSLEEAPTTHMGMLLRACTATACFIYPVANDILSPYNFQQSQQRWQLQQELVLSPYSRRAPAEAVAARALLLLLAAAAATAPQAAATAALVAAGWQLLIDMPLALQRRQPQLQQSTCRCCKTPSHTSRSKYSLGYPFWLFFARVLYAYGWILQSFYECALWGYGSGLRA